MDEWDKTGHYSNNDAPSYGLRLHDAHIPVEI